MYGYVLNVSDFVATLGEDPFLFHDCRTFPMTCEIQMEGGSEEQNERDGGQLVTVIAMFWCSGARVHSSKDI